MSAVPASFVFRLHETPVGDVLIVTGDDGIVSLHPLDGALEDELRMLAPALGGPIAPDDESAPTAVAQLDEYFAGERRQFELGLDWRLVRGFSRSALEAVRRVPFGRLASYGEVAIDAGSPRAARAVGTACARTPFSIVVPVHRVVRADGSLGEYGGRPEVKRHLVEFEHGVLAAAGE